MKRTIDFFARRERSLQWYKRNRSVSHSAQQVDDIYEIAFAEGWDQCYHHIMARRSRDRRRARKSAVRMAVK